MGRQECFPYYGNGERTEEKGDGTGGKPGNIKMQAVIARRSRNDDLPLLDRRSNPHLYYEGDCFVAPGRSPGLLAMTSSKYPLALFALAVLFAPC